MRSSEFHEPPAVSVIIPAHNEVDTIGTTLRALFADAAPGEFDVIVVCNGCTDSTAEAARQFSEARVIELEDASKTAALREGDRRTQVFPRIYLDGDIPLTTSSARAMARSLVGDAPRVAGIPGRYDLRRTSRGVRLFYEFRQRLPVFADGIIGAGVYALNSAGRQRFGVWPDVLADDQFVYRLFAPEERIVLREYHTVVEPPPTLRAEMRRGVRVRQGIVQLSTGSSEVAPLPAPAAGASSALRESARSVRGIASAIVFIVVTAAVRIRTKIGHGGDWIGSDRHQTTSREEGETGS